MARTSPWSRWRLLTPAIPTKAPSRFWTLKPAACAHSPGATVWKRSRSTRPTDGGSRTGSRATALEKRQRNLRGPRRRRRIRQRHARTRSQRAARHLDARRQIPAGERQRRDDHRTVDTAARRQSPPHPTWQGRAHRRLLAGCLARAEGRNRLHGHRTAASRGALLLRLSRRSAAAADGLQWRNGRAGTGPRRKPSRGRTKAFPWMA